RSTRGTCNSDPIKPSASVIESMPRNFRTSSPLCGHKLSTCNSRRPSDRSRACSFMLSVKRSGTSLCTSTATSPWRPWVFTTRARVMNPSLGSGLNDDASPSLLDDFERIAPAGPVLGSGTGGFWRGSLREQLVHTLRHLRALGHPVFHALTFHFDRGGIGAGIVGPHHFHGTAVARARLLNDHNAIVRFFARTHARQTNH